MATEKDFAPTEWQMIEAARFMAGIAVTYGDLSSKRAIADEATASASCCRHRPW